MYNSSQNPLETGWDLYQGQGDTKKLSFNWKLNEYFQTLISAQIFKKSKKNTQTGSMVWIHLSTPDVLTVGRL